MKTTPKTAANPPGRKPSKTGSVGQAANPQLEAPSTCVGTAEPASPPLAPIPDDDATGSGRGVPTVVYQKGSKGGAPIGSQNAIKHGVRGYLVTGRLPKSANYIRKQLGQLRRQLESAVAESHGEVTLYHAAVIQSTVRHEARATLLNRYLSTEKELSLSDRMGLLGRLDRRRTAATNA